MQTMNDRVAAFIESGGKKPDAARTIKLDDLGWPEGVRGLDGLYDEWAQ